jgi:integrase
MPLTDAHIKALQPRESRYLITDGRGLSLDVLPSGVKSWMYRYRLDGSYGKVTLGRYPDLTLKAARDKRDQFATQVAAGRSPAEEKKARRAGGNSAPTVREFGDRYYREQVVRNRKKPTEILRYLEREIYPAFGSKRLRDVTALDVQELVYRKRDNGRESAAIMIRQVIKLVFDYAVHEQLASANPATMVATRYIGRARKRSRKMSPREIRLYLRTIYQSNIRRQFKLALHILLLTLKRKSELLNARWEHIDFEAGEWLIPEQNSKSGKPQIVYLSTQVAEMFRELRKLAGESELVLPGRSSTRRPFAANALNKALEGVTFDMEPVTIHDLRRTASTLLTEHNFDKDVIEKALAHERQGIRAVYILAEYAEQRKRMLQWWADYVEGVLNESKVLIGNFGEHPEVA